MAERDGATIGVTRAAFDRLADAYRKHWQIELSATRADGKIVWATSPASPKGAVEARQRVEARGLAIQEALRWGEPTPVPADNATHPGVMWAAPLMHNAAVTGGLVAEVDEARLLDAEGQSKLDVRWACAHLRWLAERDNLTNGALLARHRQDYERERRRADAIHTAKLDRQFNLRQLYLGEEPQIIAAIRRGDRHEATAILNRLLVEMHHRAGERIELIKSFFMELVVAMTRAAVEAGGDPEELLGANFASITELAGFDDEEPLTAWLTDMMQRLFDAIESRRSAPEPMIVSSALQYMADHCGKSIGRDDVARFVHLSPSHFSRVFKAVTGRGYSETLARLRVDRAAELLLHTDKALSEIAQECGFPDQSYFTKVFRKYRDAPPRQYRERHR